MDTGEGYLKLFIGEGKTVGVDKMPTQTEFEIAEHGSSVKDEAIKKLVKLNVISHEDILLSIDTRLLLERLHSIWSTHATLKTFLK